MYPNHDRIHASLPVELASITVSYCEACQSWRVSSTAYRQISIDGVVDVRGSVVNCGPFDDWSDVLRIAQEQLASLGPLPASPGS